jgi:RNA polymerase sigma-70 factor (ECF subfamily)
MARDLREPHAPLTHDDLVSLERGLEIVAARSLGSPEDVADAVQETLARAVQARLDGHLPEGASLRAFVHGILRHVVADVHRRRRREFGTGAGTDQLEDPRPDALASLITKEDRASAARALLRLSAPERELLDLCFRKGERIVDIAGRLGVPPPRLRKRKSRALQHLRELMSPPATSIGSQNHPPSDSGADDD